MKLHEYITNSLVDPAVPYTAYDKVFVVVKPGFLQLTDDILKRFAEDGWVIDKTIVKKLLLKEAHKLYQIHKKKDFYKPLCEYMSSDISRAFILKRKSQDDNPFKAVAKIKDEIREKYGESDMRNVLHSSDKMENMMNEAPIYFGVV